MQNQNNRFDRTDNKHNNRQNNNRGERRPRPERPDPVTTPLQKQIADFFQGQINDFYPKWEEFKGQAIDAEAFRQECRKTLKLESYPTHFENEESGESTDLYTVEQQLRMDRETGDLIRLSITCVGLNAEKNINFYVVAYLTENAESITVTPFTENGSDSYNRLHCGAKH